MNNAIFALKNHPITSDLSQILASWNFYVNDTCHHICVIERRALKDFKNGFTSIVDRKSTELKRLEILKTFKFKYTLFQNSQYSAFEAKGQHCRKMPKLV